MDNDFKDLKEKKSGFATAALVLGIIGICFSFVPIINNIAFILGILAFVFAIVSLVNKASKGKAIAGLILGILSVVITLSLQSSWAESLDKVSDDLDNAAGNNTEETLGRDVDVSIGTLEGSLGEYGLVDSKLTVTVTNKTDDVKSFTIQIEAVDASGSRIDTDYVYANSLGANQSQDFDIFTYVSSEDLEAMQSATFNVVEVSMY